MDDFRSLEARYSAAPLRLVEDSRTAGVLGLDGDRSSLELSSDHPIELKGDDNGWYDVRLRANDGRELLLHHALTREHGHHSWADKRQSAHYAKVFPNVVVDDVRGLCAGHHVHRIHFRIDELDSFFYYEYAEPLRCYDATGEQLEALRGMRYVPERDRIFDPLAVYVVHNYPRFFSFDVGDRTYSVGTGGSFSSPVSWSHVEAHVYPIATIGFRDPVTIDAALDRVWEWRRFFSQLAMQPLTLRAVGVQASLDETAVIGSVYLPNLSRRPVKSAGRYGVSPAYLPLNSWHERDAFAQAMHTWLNKNADRATMRSCLDWVIERMSRRADPTDVITLASGIDSLTEIGERGRFRREAFDAIVGAAHQAAKESNVPVSADRIRGLLGGLQRPSLAMRIRELGDTLNDTVDTDDVARVAKSATRIRNAFAHGGAASAAAQVQPRIAPTIHALAALCALFDLQSSGIPAQTANSSGITLIRFREAVAELRSS